MLGIKGGFSLEGRKKQSQRGNDKEIGGKECERKR